MASKQQVQASRKEKGLDRRRDLQKKLEELPDDCLVLVSLYFDVLLAAGPGVDLVGGRVSTAAPPGASKPGASAQRGR